MALTIILLTMLVVLFIYTEYLDHKGDRLYNEAINELMRQNGDFAKTNMELKYEIVRLKSNIEILENMTRE